MLQQKLNLVTFLLDDPVLFGTLVVLMDWLHSNEYGAVSREVSQSEHSLSHPGCNKEVEVKSLQLIINLKTALIHF